MFGKKLFLILGGYVVWNVVASLYTGKKGKEVKTDLKKAKKEGKDEAKVLFENIWNTNLSFFDDIKHTIYSEKTKKILHKKGEEILHQVEQLKEEGKKLIVEFQEKSGEYTGDIKDKVETLYATKKEEVIKKVKKEAPRKTKEVKDTLTSTYKATQEKLKK